MGEQQPDALAEPTVSTSADERAERMVGVFIALADEAGLSTGVIGSEHPAPDEPEAPAS